MLGTLREQKRKEKNMMREREREHNFVFSIVCQHMREEGTYPLVWKGRGKNKTEIIKLLWGFIECCTLLSPFITTFRLSEKQVWSSLLLVH